MGNIDDKLKKYIDMTESSMLIYDAPNISNDIWQRHQSKKMTKYLSLAASTSIICLAIWLQSSTYNTPTIIAQNNELEMQLAKMENIQLQGQQKVVMDNWHYELALLDQNIELTHTKSDSLWSRRTMLLTKMIAFYAKPIDFYEI
ncbi:hypothetical protein AAD001_07175 [Colwelliaceae bacterium 6471]